VGVDPGVGGMITPVYPSREKRRDKPAKCSEGGIRTLRG
jgi:hypothetical protein